MAANAIHIPCRRCCAEGLAFHASYTIPAVTKAMVRQLTRRGLRRSLAKDGSCVVQWAPFTKMNWNRVLAGTYHASASHWQRFSVLILDGYLCAGELISSCYYIHAGLVHKCLLYRVFRLLRSSAKGDAAVACAAAPISLEVPSLACVGDGGSCGEAFAEFRSRVHSIGGAWVLKEGNTNNAIAVHTFDHSELDAALALVSSDGDRVSTHPESGDSKGGKPNAWVVQQYVSDVLLLRGCKFHVRVNVLAVGNLCVYVHDDMVFHVACAVRTASYCLSRLCASARAKLTMLHDDQPFVNADWGNKWVHVTNHGVQRHHPDYNHDRKTLTWSGFMTEVAVGRAGVDIKRKCQELRSAIHQVVAGTFACMEVRLHRVNVCPCAKPFTYLPLSRHNGSYSCPCPTASKCLGLTCLLMRHGSRGFWRYAIRVVMHGVALTCPPPCCCQVNECPALEGLAHPVCVLVGDYAGVTRLTLTCRRNCAKEWLTTCLGWCSTPCYQPTRHPSSHRRSLVCCPVTTATVGTRRSTSERQVRRLWQPHGMWCMRGTT